MTNIYELSTIRDDPRYDQFDFDSIPSLLKNDYLSNDFWGPHYLVEPFGPVPLKHLWKEVTPKGTVRPFVDFTGVSYVPTFSERAVNALRDILESNGELLPIKTKKGKYFVYNLLTIGNCLDLARTRGAKHADAGFFRSVEYFWFDASKLDGLTIFRIREHPQVYFVTELFKNRVEAAGLNGFYFIKVWPFPEGESWDDAETIRSRRERGKVAPLKGQCVTIQLELVKGQAVESVEEQVREYAFQLEELLADNEHNYIGAVDDIEGVKKEARIILCCPNADKLLERIQPWLNQLDWPAPVRVEKRFGNRFDEDAETETIAIKP